MKSVIFALALSVISANAFAMSKNCEGANNDDTTKGETLTVDVTQKSVVATENSDYAGTYPAEEKAPTVAGKDGHTYLQYDLGGEEGCDTVLVDENLLKAKGQGWVKFRCRGEGFQDTKFFCKP